MLDTLMARLGYTHYLASNTGPGVSSPAEIDFRVLDRLATAFPSSCLGVHLIAPPLAAPRVLGDPWLWAKWCVASFLQAGVLGYADDDFPALESAGYRLPYQPIAPRKIIGPRELGLNALGLREPNTAAYALCDSPTGLLAFVIRGLRSVGPALNFGPEQLITLTNLAWLPGPENAMRFWAHCATHHDDGTAPALPGRPRVAITAFLGGKGGAPSGDAEPVGGEHGADFPQTQLPNPPTMDTYACPAWGNSRYTVVHAQRLRGRAGLLAWERPEAIRAGIRALAREVLAADSRLAARVGEEPATAPLIQVVVPADENPPGGGGGPALSSIAQGKKPELSPPLTSPALTSPTSVTSTRPTTTASTNPPAPAPTHLPLPPPLPVVARHSSSSLSPGSGKGKETSGDEETPDTLVDQPILEDAPPAPQRV
jgi:hypothetical protein